MVKSIIMVEALKTDATSLMFPSELGGWLAPNEGTLLYQLARKNRELGVVVELGSYHGKSTICLAQGVQNINDGKVYAVDGFKGNRYADDGDFLSKFMQNVAAYGVGNSVNPIRGDFLEVAKTWNKPIRLLFMDGSHQYEDVKRDFDVWERHVVMGGVIAFHDSLNSPGVTRFIIETMRSGRFKQCETLNSKSGLTYLVKAKPEETVSDSNISTSIDKLNALARKKVLPRFASGVAEKITLLNRRFK